jgi:hypothetical protein
MWRRWVRWQVARQLNWPRRSGISWRYRDAKKRQHRVAQATAGFRHRFGRIPGSQHLTCRRPPIVACTCCGHPACWQVVRRDSSYEPRHTSDHMGSGQPAQHWVRTIPARCTNVTARYRRSSRLDRHMAGPAASDLWVAPWLVRGRARWVERSVVHARTECPLRYFRNAE